MKRFFLLLWLAASPLLAGAAIPLLDADAMIERLAACAACHGVHGEGAVGAEYYPHLAGKPAGYLFAQMQGFRDGRRHYPQMVYLMRNWDDAWLARIAQFYAGQSVVAPQHAAPAPLTGRDLARAEAFVRDGNPDRGLPACSACHGSALTGIEPGVPALAGLPLDYLIAQLGGWMTGARHSIEPDCMAEVVQHLQPGEIRLLATYISSLVPETGSHPAAAGSWELPHDCGGATYFDPATGVLP